MKCHECLAQEAEPGIRHVFRDLGTQRVWAEVGWRRSGGAWQAQHTDHRHWGRILAEREPGLERKTHG